MYICYYWDKNGVLYNEYMVNCKYNLCKIVFICIVDSVVIGN